MTRDKIPQTETFSHLFLALSSHCELGRELQTTSEGKHCRTKKQDALASAVILTRCRPGI